MCVTYKFASHVLTNKKAIFVAKNVRLLWTFNALYFNGLSKDAIL